MKLSKEDIQDVIEIISQAEDFRPIVKSIIDTLKSFSGELKDIPESVGKWLVERRVAAIKQYEDAGFTRNEAMMMTFDDINAYRQMIRNMNNGPKSAKAR